MSGLIRWYNANRKKVWTTIGIVIFVILLINVLNNISHEQLSEKNNEIKNSTSNTYNKEIMNSISMSEDKSVLSGDKISTSQKNMLKVLDDFGNYCSNGEIEKAYNLLSDNCKSEIYPTKEDFEEGYYKQIFDGTKINISAENWMENTYKVKFTEDALTTGVNSSYAKQDYITLITDEYGSVKLNINGYMGKKKINKTVQKNNLKFKVIETDVYMDYQTYTFEITNSSANTVYLNDPTINNSMYLEDRNNKQYAAYMHELSPAELRIVPGETKRLTVKYYNKYSSTREIEYIVFGRIILNYDNYTEHQNIGYYNNYDAVQIEL